MANRRYQTYEEHRQPCRDHSPKYSSGGARDYRDLRDSCAPSMVCAPRSPSHPPPSSGTVIPHRPSRARRSAIREAQDRAGAGVDDPINRTKGFIDDNFTHSPTGLGASLIGAVVGGLVAREASAAVERRRYFDGHCGSEGGRARELTTVLGAVAGGAGANAVANRVEDSKIREREIQGHRDRDYYRDSGRR